MRQSIIRIGSVVRFEDSIFLVVGMRHFKEGNTCVLKYIIVPYPAGFLDFNSLLVVEASSVKVIREGRQTAISDKFIDYIMKMDSICNEYSLDTIKGTFSELFKRFEEH